MSFSAVYVLSRKYQDSEPPSHCTFEIDKCWLCYGSMFGEFLLDISTFISTRHLSLDSGCTGHSPV